MTPCEYYARAVVTDGQLEAILGLEFEPGEDLVILRHEMKVVLRKAIEATPSEFDKDVLLARAVALGVAWRWPGRRWFIEVQHDDPNEGWVQVITPSGWPPKEEE